jgi:hypothetical protein
MSNLSDKEIDRLSREAADSYEPDDSFLSWSRLEQKLIQQMPERPPDGFRFGRINPYIWGPAIVLLAGASFFLIKNNFYSQHSTRNNQTLTQPVSSSATNDKQAGGNTIHPDSISSAANNVAARRKNETGSILLPAIPDAHIRNAGAAVSGSGQPKTENQNPETVSGNKGSRTTVAESSTVLSNGNTGNNRAGGKSGRSEAILQGSSQAAGSIASVSQSNIKNEANANGSDGSGTENGLNKTNGYQRNKNQIGLPFVVNSGKGLGKVSGNDSLMNLVAQSKTPIRPKSLHLNRSLNIGFIFGPDYTNAGGIANNQIGNNIGLSVGYYLTSNLSINTGIIYSNKFYWSNAHNYFFRPTANITPIANGTFAAPPPIDYINGSSNIWELPLTLRYDFAHHNKTKFFANAGLSSYFMMKQTYIYFLHSGQNPLAYKITDDQQVNYWFGVADVSVGFEAEIGKGFSFQAEPFLKLPLQNMGSENLKLTSYGFLLSFKYAPVLSRSKK